MKNIIFSEDYLETFLCVARLKSFSDAASELGLTTPAVSYSIKRLENALGVKLIERSTRKVSLTKAGEYFLRKSDFILDEYRNITRGIVSIDQEIEVRLRVCINNLMHTPEHTAQLARLIKKQFPTCQLDISTEVYSGVWDALIHEQIDVAIGAPDQMVSGGSILYKQLDSIHWIFVVSKNHPLLKLDGPIPDSALRQYPAVCVDDTASHIIKKVAWLLHGQEALYVPDMNTKLYLQEKGVGIGFLPDYMARAAIDEGRLVPLNIQNPRQPSPMLLAWHSSCKGRVMQWISGAFEPGKPLAEIYSNLLH